MTLNDIYLLSPEIALVCVAIAIILLDLFVSRKRVLLYVGVVGLALPVVFSVLLWNDLAAEPTGNMTGIFGTLVCGQVRAVLQVCARRRRRAGAANVRRLRRALQAIPRRILRG